MHHSLFKFRPGPVAVLIVFLMTVSCSGDAGSAGLSDDFARIVEALRQAYQVPGAAVGIVRDDQVIFLQGFGVGNLARPVPVDENTRFQIASNTKFMTAAAIGVLVDRGVVEWDAPLITYDPAFRMPTEEATGLAGFRDMLAHRAGFRDYEGGLLGRLGYTYDEMLFRVRYMELPGFRDKSRYSNVGFFVAGEIAAAAAGVADWETQINRDLLVPLGLNRTSPYHDSLYLDQNHARAHRLVNGQAELMNQEIDPLPPAGQIVSTARDMCRWMRLLLNGGIIDGRRLLEPATVKALMAPVISNTDGGPLNEPDSANGLGCNSYTFLGHRIIEKNGALDGVRTVITLIPELNTGIVVLANLDLTVFPEAVRAQFLEDQLGPSGQDLQAYYREVVQPQWSRIAARPEPPENPEPCPVPVENLVGNYVSRLYGNFSVSLVDGELVLTSQTPTPYSARMPHWNGLQYLVIWPIPDDWFGLVAFTPDSSEPGKVTGFEGQPRLEGYFMFDYGRFERQ